MSGGEGLGSTVLCLINLCILTFQVAIILVDANNNHLLFNCKSMLLYRHFIIQGRLECGNEWNTITRRYKPTVGNAQYAHDGRWCQRESLKSSKNLILFLLDPMIFLLTPRILRINN